jgi:hypothetical protein
MFLTLGASEENRFMHEQQTSTGNRETVDSPEDEAKLSARMGSHVRSPDGRKKLYQFALLETEPAKMIGRIADPRTAILDRMAELETCPSSDEVRALNDALAILADSSEGNPDGRPK